MVATLTRRALLRGRVKAKQVMRPPHAIAETSFTRACNACSACVQACPEHIIEKDEWGRPTLSFAANGCTFCADCTQACDTGALDKTAARPWNWVARIENRCLNQSGVSCRLCEEFCDTRALSIRPALGGRYQVLIDASACSGCGACIGPSPAGAISLTPSRPDRAETSS